MYLVGVMVFLWSMQENVITMRTVIAKNQTSLLVMEGRMVRLSCRTDKPWFFCLWNSPSLEQSCAIQYHQPTSVCTKSNRSRIIGGRNACDLQLEVSRPDHGTWMCLVNDNTEFNTIKEFISLKVGVAADTGVTIEGGEAFNDGVLHLVDGDKIDMSCYAKHGYPAAEVQWSAALNGESRSLVVSQARVMSSSDHTISISQTAHYTASPQDNNKTIECLISQVDGSEVILRQNISLSLHVKERRVAAPLVEQVPLLSGLLLLIIFLLLSCVLLTLLVVRHRGKERRRRELMESERQNIPLVMQTQEDVLKMPRWRSEQYQKYCNGDVLTEIADVTKPLSTTYRDNLTDLSSFRGKSPSVSDMTSLYSHEDVTVIDNPFNPPDFEQLPNNGTIPCQPEPTLGSVPQLYKRRSSIPARILINPTSFPPPQNAKSLGHLNNCSEHCQGSQRRRRKTAPATSKSSHSVFDCDEGCFEVEHVHKSHQMVFIATGPMVI